MIYFSSSFNGKRNSQKQRLFGLRYLSDYYIGLGLYGKGKYTKVANHFQSFYESYKQVPMIIDLGLASLAACHIELKEYDKLEGIYQYLSNYDHPYAASYVTYAKAKMEAQLGHTDKAIALLKQSKSEGQAFLWFKFQNDPFLAPLFEEAGFKEISNIAL